MYSQGKSLPIAETAETPPEKGSVKSDLADHLIPLYENKWALWRCVGLRAAGFPTVEVLDLAAPECAGKADDLIAAEDRAAKAINMALESLHLSEFPDLTVLRKLRRLLKKGRLPQGAEAEILGEEQIQTLQSAQSAVEKARSEFVREFDVALDRTSRAIHSIASNERFCEAVLWQNRHALSTGIKPILRRTPGDSLRTSKDRQHEELIASYLHRYCTKNDTIGFFGPVGWVELVSEGEAIRAVPGSDLLASRSVNLEVWCIDAIAEALFKDRKLEPWVAPQRKPFIHVVGNLLHLPSRRPVKLTSEQAAVLHACDGERTAIEIARGLLKNPLLKVRSEEDVLHLIRSAHDSDLISWNLEVPLEMYPERNLRRILERVEDEELRATSLEALGKIEAARDAIIAAAGDVPKLEKALGDLESTFTELTGLAATRSDGEVYAARTLAFEDCRRDIEVKIGPDLVRELGQPLSLLLTSARWFCYEFAREYREIFQGIYTQLAQKTGSSIIDFATFWYRIQPIIFAGRKQAAEPIRAIFQKRWQKLLPFSPDQRRVYFKSAEIRQQVEQMFTSPSPGWSFARYHNPDIMISASSVEAIRLGDYELVLGELHLGVNTLATTLFLSQHPSPEDFIRNFESDFKDPRAVLIVPKTYRFGKTSRLQPVRMRTIDVALELTTEPTSLPRSQVLPIGSFVVEDRGNGLILRTRDGRLLMDIIDVLGDALAILIDSSFKLFPQSDHIPRISIDRLVVWRESWSFAVTEIPFAFEKSSEMRFLVARRWASAKGLPRFIFARSPIEVKPIYIDLASPISIDIFAKIIRLASENGPAGAVISITEMLPALDQSWLPDKEDRRYTSELRVIAFDLP